MLHVGLVMTAGSITVDPTASGLNAGGVTEEFFVSVISAIPEPATLALLGIALAGLGFSRRKRPI